MAKLSPEERAALEKQLADDDQADDDNDEIEFGFPDGGYIRGSYRRVSAAAEARGHRLSPAPAADGQAAGKGGGQQGGGNVKRFNAGRRTG